VNVNRPHFSHDRAFRRALLIGTAAAFGLAACDRKPAEKPGTPTPSPTPVETPRPTPLPTPTPQPTPPPTPTPVPTPYVPNKTLNVGSLFNGINFRAKLETVQGTTAAAERGNAESYSVEVSVKVTVPKPHRNLVELSKLNERIGTLLPGLEEMLGTAKVSPEFDELYRRKVTSLRSNLDRLDALLSRHNFFDCETILEIQNPKTKRHALLIQSDMDVDTDGADGDRLPTFDTTSRTYQPFTSYRWKKRTAVPNPCVPIWEKRIAENDVKIKDAKTPAAEVQKLKSDNARLRMEIADMQANSFLIGTQDPFIVLPTQMFTGKKGPFSPRMGDFCVILAGDTFYPAIIGDAGPTTKIGEASLRICKQISAKASGVNRAVSDLKVTYIVFPNTALKDWGPPDLKLWQARCDALLKELGEYGGDLFQWEEPVVAPPLPEAAAPAPAQPDAAPPAGEKAPAAKP
jgi:hypothetical protein